MAVLILTPRPELLDPAQLSRTQARRVEVEADALRGLERLEKESWEIVLVDSAFAGGAGLELVEKLATSGQSVLLMSAEPSLSLTVKALRLGARDVIAMPPPANRLREILEVETRSAGAVVPQADGSNPEWIGSSPIMLNAFRAALRLATSNQPVLLWGETGTGKELLARVLHENSDRAGHPFITVNCGFLPENVLTAELFGHTQSGVPGVFTRRTGRIQRAAGGTLYLDEVSDAAPRVQVKLMDALRRGVVEAIGGDEAEQVQARIIGAINDDPQTLVTRGRLRGDLYYEFAGGTIHLPPLRERGEADIRALAQHFMESYAARYNRTVFMIADDAWKILVRHPWTGNVRQLRSAMERAVLEADGDVIHATHLPAELTREVRRADSELSLRLEDLERQHIMKVLGVASGRVGEAAEMLGIHRNTLRRKLQQYDIHVE